MGNFLFEYCFHVGCSNAALYNKGNPALCWPLCVSAHLLVYLPPSVYICVYVAVPLSHLGLLERTDGLNSSHSTPPHPPLKLTPQGSSK